MNSNFGSKAAHNFDFFLKKTFFKGTLTPLYLLNHKFVVRCVGYLVFFMFSNLYQLYVNNKDFVAFSECTMKH